MEGHRPHRILRPQIRSMIDESVREAVKKDPLKDGDTVLRVFVSEDLLPLGPDADAWKEEETRRLDALVTEAWPKRGGGGAPSAVEILILDTKRSFTHARIMSRATPAHEAPAVAPGPKTPEQTSTETMVGTEPVEGEVAPGQPVQGSAVVRFLTPNEARMPLEFRTHLILGRDDEEGVVGLGDPRVSRRHIRLRIREGFLVATDLGSKNGSFVNEERLKPYGNQILEVGDVLRIGTIRLRVDGTGS